MSKESLYKDFNFFCSVDDGQIFLVAPYPPSNNRNARFGSRGIYKDKKTYDYLSSVKSAFKWLPDMPGCPFECPLTVSINVYPNLPKDHAKRLKNEGSLWWIKVRCLDLDNVSKTILDALNSIAYIDDSQIVRLRVNKMKPDEKGARLELSISEFKE